MAQSHFLDGRRGPHSTEITAQAVTSLQTLPYAMPWQREWSKGELSLLMHGPGRTVRKSWLMNEGEGMGDEDEVRSIITVENGTYLGYGAKSRGQHSELTERIY